MQLVLNSYGTYLHKKGDCFEVKRGEEKFLVSVKKVDSILITTAAYLSTDAIKLAMDHNIDMVFLDGFGDPYGRVWHSKLGSTVAIRRRQLEISEKEEGLELAKEWVLSKMDNQMALIEKLSGTRPDKKEKIGKHVEKIRGIRAQVDALSGTIDEKRGSVMGLEGASGRVYFGALGFIMPERFKFDGRSRRPAKDEFNCMLNYGYGVLYSMVEKACIIAGLDPYIGFLHADNYNKKSLVFDLIEPFRILVDETVVHLFSGRQVKKKHFDQVKGGLTLNKEGKAVLLEALNKKLDKSVRYRGRNIKNRDIIQFDCHRIANSLIKDMEL